ncbi:capsular exopolysaccharide biosynthesis protein [Pleurocapsa sp. PCC 7327]|uniref:GumC family protein n=1 Tax=Pleurocapsa sp. PCC 7327 TaxID=118163 RepID=UPI00029FDA3A|nr:polysaccharide biosynthesis tyrosine autokinase [Pleurocapsa sp. PCC 7327]AFY77928.1 capsular exopolysaccharide biosynthesis protein [Pleurocapsa sp. PCC 7327]
MEDRELLDLDFGKYLIALKRRWVPMVGVFLAAIGLSALSITLLKPSYQAEGKLLFKEDRSTMLMGLGNEIGQLKPLVSTQNPLNTQIEILTSTPLLQKTIDALNLKDEEGKPLKPKDFKKKLEVKIIGGTDVLKVVYTSSDPKLAAAVVNQLIQFYREIDILNKRDEAQAARKSIANQLPKAEAALRQAEIALRQFKLQNKIVDLAEESKSAVEKIKILDNDIATTKARFEGVEAQVKAWRKQLGLSFEQAIAAQILSKSPAIQAIFKDLEQVEQDLANERSRYQESHPIVVTLKEKQTEIRDNLQRQIRKTLGSEARIPDGLLENNRDRQTQNLMEDYIQIEKERLDLAQQLLSQYNSRAAYQQRANLLPKLEQKQRVLERQLETARTTYTSLFQKIQEAQLAAQKDSTNVSIVEGAIVPEKPQLSQPLKVLALGTILGAFLSTTTVLVLERKDRTLKTVKEIKQLFGYPLLGIVPSLDRQKKFARLDENSELPIPTLVVQNTPDSPISESYRMLQSNLKFLSSDRQQKIIVVTSSVSKEGKSTVAANLAAAMAQVRHKVLLVDANLHHPIQHRIWELYPNVGLSNLLVEQITLSKALKQAVIPNLDILSSGVIPPSPATILDSQRMTLLLREFTRKYDFVIIDTPSLNLAADAPILSRMADGMLLVVKPGVVERDSAIFAKEILEQSGQNVLGIVVNGVIPDREPYSYYYFAPESKQESASNNNYPEVREDRLPPSWSIASNEFSLDDGYTPSIELGNTSIHELEQIALDFQYNWEQLQSLVNDQEEELVMQEQTIRELQERLNRASQRERLTLEQELAYELEKQKMLRATLVGQRYNLQKKHELLRQYQVLQRGQVYRSQDIPSIDSV